MSLFNNACAPYDLIEDQVCIGGAPAERSLPPPSSNSLRPCSNPTPDTTFGAEGQSERAVSDVVQELIDLWSLKWTLLLLLDMSPSDGRDPRTFHSSCTKAMNEMVSPLFAMCYVV
jgi:hypothetical protein